MTHKLKHLFPSLISLNHHPNAVYDDYTWFITTDDEVVGILTEDLSPRDLSLLEAILTPHNPALPTMTKEEHYWEQRIKTGETDGAQTESSESYRFVYFSVQPNQIKPQAFKEAISELFNKNIPILWNDDHSGLMIESPVESGDEAISYEQIIDILMSDLYVNIHFFVGPIMNDHADARTIYKQLIDYAETAFRHSDQSVLSYVEAMPAILVNEMEPHNRSAMIEAVLNEFVHDTDMLHTIETFVQCHLNVSITAKKLYMHRNSLQYRLDKFIEKTGIDIRQFPLAVTVYLALLANKME
ncbi:PucR family transcriptional regulator [Lentibacillus saliphilus]|uniref:PucR family transcriptional regulator n=1 Tax=Lentibacillus saliphilus TaxID=2737028 RepID=UPI001C2F1319|nr:helix-turn-helix domain-containing protein [Lentibacillus saliphilus]